MKFNLSDNERIEIKRLHRSCSQRRHADKLKSLLLLDKGYSCAQVGDILLLDDDTIRTYRSQCLSAGAQSLLSDQNKGGSSKLLDVQLQELDKHLEHETYCNSKGIVTWIAQQYGIKYTTSGVNAQTQGKIHIILDNARYYHALIVKEFLKEHPRIKLHFLPPYSPNLNIIERLWKILKTKVVYNKFYLKFQDFRKAVMDFLETEQWKNKEYDNLLSDNFQIIKPDFSGSYLV